MKEASERLDEMKLNEKDAKEYKRYLKGLRDIASDQHTKMADAQDLINQGINKDKEEKEVEAVLGLIDIGLALKITIERVRETTSNQTSK